MLPSDWAGPSPAGKAGQWGAGGGRAVAGEEHMCAEGGRGRGYRRGLGGQGTGKRGAPVRLSGACLTGMA